MSSSIWTRCAGSSELRELRLEPWRVVEAQHQVSTRKLVATEAEQHILEEMIEGAKPLATGGTRLHYLLYTPFRYPPLRHGSRFGGRQEPGIWYGSETLSAVFSEVAYYRLLFLEGTHAELGVVATQLTAFTARVRTLCGVDLSAPPFDRFRGDIASPKSYVESQALGTAMRAAGVEAFRYPSARAADGVNVGVFTPAAFIRGRPRNLQTWHCTAMRDRVEMSKRDYFERASFSFARSRFLEDGRLPAPAP